MRNLIEEARTCHGEHTTHGKFIQELADYAEAAKRDAEEAEAYAAELEAELSDTQDRANAFATKEYYTEMRAKRAEAKLAKAVETIDDLISTYVWVREDEYERGWSEMGGAVHEARFVQMELKGDD